MSTAAPSEVASEKKASAESEMLSKRFQPSKSVLLIDRWMTQFIKVGGVLIVAAVLGIFVFISYQIIPLFGGAEVRPHKKIDLPGNDFQVLGIDEWGELPVLVDSQGTISFLDLTGKKGHQTVDLGLSEQKKVTAFKYNPIGQEIILGTEDGNFTVVQINYATKFEGSKRFVSQDLKASPFVQIGQPGFPIRNIAYGDSGTDKLVATVQDINGQTEVYATTLSQERSLMGTGEIVQGQTINLSHHFRSKPETIAVNQQANAVVVSTDNGDMYYFERSGDEISLRQTFQAFSDRKENAVSSMDFLFGGVSLVLTNPRGMNRIFSLYEKAEGEQRLFYQTKEFQPLKGAGTFYANSVRNKAFLIGSGSEASLRYGTTADIRWQEQLPFEVTSGVIGGKYNSLLFLDNKNHKLHVYELKDPHPESSLKALFGKVWYEGSPEPKYEWQSTGATDDFESKISLIPLIIGTLKGTFYAMLFATPIALLAAIYTSQFLHPRFRIIVKPMMEVMASLPSVVLGFLAALWLAPVLETKVPSIIMILIAVPTVSLLIGWLWGFLPVELRVKIKPGYEWIAFIPILLIVSWIAWQMGPVLEKVLFTVKDPTTGIVIPDFRLWWTQATNFPFEQRNSLVVGFMMGFAVIPIIFTIAEDALSNVPGALRSGSLALGASRWQTALRIVLPTASAGIFSAIMIGLGRAVGETMIVVMATGNTPIMDFNIFSGMRTLSANIAVELPEAPVHGTLYRVLFLGGLALFVLTFIVNTFAEILRQHLREKYKTV